MVGNDVVIELGYPDGYILNIEEDGERVDCGVAAAVLAVVDGKNDMTGLTVGIELGDEVGEVLEA